MITNLISDLEIVHYLKYFILHVFFSFQNAKFCLDFNPMHFQCELRLLNPTVYGYYISHPAL